MKFGLIKSKIEKCLTESYLNDTLKKDIFIFKELVLKNKTLKEMYHLYDELSSNKGYSKQFAEEFINESINFLVENSKKINKKNIEELNLWLSDITSQNQYEDIDNLVYTNSLNLESRIKSKKVILEGLEKTKENYNVVNVPVSKTIEVANKTIEHYLNNINESERKEVKKILSEDNDKLLVKYEVLKESTLDKLNDLKSTIEDVDVTSRIDQTINKLNNESYNRVNYYKLKELFTNL